MKKVFSSHAQVAHVWANQSQDSGRTKNMFFEGTDIYSYGEHYLAGRIHAVKGKRFALVRSDAYSPSTAKHLSRIRRAVSGLMSYFCVPKNVTDVRGAVAALDAMAQTQITQSLKKIKVTDRHDISIEMDYINNAFNTANELRNLLGMVEKHPNEKQLLEVKKHLLARLKRYHELNTPEMIAKRKVEAEKREDRKAKKAILDTQEKIIKFRNGENVSLHELPYSILRIQGTEVVTSGGARVPLADAITLYRAIESGKDVTGATVGHFTLERITDVVSDNFENDKVVKIGCHKILLSEARSLLSLKAA